MSNLLNRENSISAIKQNLLWDILIIGGGATGLGVAVDAASRGYKTLLLERGDFACGTSSRSTKLAHGGVRYLAQGNIGLVNEALKERGLMMDNAPHLVHEMPFIIPNYQWWNKFYYGLGLRIYDWMARSLRIGKTNIISKSEVLNRMHNLNPKNLSGGVVYFDGQFDDARFAINLAQTACRENAVLVNYMEVRQLIKNEGKVAGVKCKDLENGDLFEISAKVVINATGVFSDAILSLDHKEEAPIIKVSQGIHIVLKKEFLEGNSALMIPKTSDGRVLFAVPWKGHLLVGTTDTPLSEPTAQPKALNHEIAFVMDNLQNYLVKKPTLDDILSVFAGLRPLVVPHNKGKSTQEISRDHKLIVDQSKLITITGGKWTTYRKMAEDTVDKASKIGGFKEVPCVTESLRIHGFLEEEDILKDHWSVYGSDAALIKEIANKNVGLADKIHPNFPHILAEAIWFIRYEMARTIEDILGRRFRILFLDAQAAVESAPLIAKLLKDELGKDDAWEQEQLENFKKVSKNYFPISS